MIEYPKHVYVHDEDGKPTREFRLVKNADEEAAAKADGFQAIKSVQPAEGAQPAGPEHLEYPKHVYRGADDARETKRVENAEQEAAARADGYVPFGELEAPSDGVEYLWGLLTAKEAVEAVKASEDKAALEAAQAVEKRKTVLAAIDARLAELA